MLNTAKHAIGFLRLSKGGLTGTIVDPGLIMVSALKTNAHGVILAHNHPSGSTQPSQTDIALTKKIASVLLLIDKELLDHIVLTVEGYYSFADEGV